ncbi:RimK family alpha-L-glutamate ligase [Ruminococcus sp.]|uniref:ATP-grasp domain-containing protein n=1 Tax=Ruminococcus sp. TaxID=41978 RepID=UPI00386BD06A
MTGWIVYDSKQYERNRWFAEELQKHCLSFCDAKLIITERLSFGISDNCPSMLYDNTPISAPDFVIMRSIFPLLSDFLETAGARVFNDSTTARICNDKRLTHLSVLRSGVRMMDTLFFDRDYFSQNDLSALSYPAVVKSASGHGGKEVFFVNSSDELLTAVSSIHDSRFLIQNPFSPSGQDLRVYVLGGRVIGSALRTSDSLKSNFSLGGKATFHTLAAHEQSAVSAVLAALPFSPDFIGIDFLYGGADLIFNEIEDVVGTRMLYETSDLDPASLYVSYIKNVMESRSSFDI